MRKVKKAYYLIKILIKLVKKELHSIFSIGFIKRLKLYLNGFFVESYYIYNFNKNNKKDYLSDYFRFTKCSFLNYEYASVLDNKIIFEQFFKTKCNVIQHDFLFLNGRIINLSKKFFFNAYNDIISELKKGVEFIIKPVSGGGGKKIFFIQYGSVIQINNKPINESFFIRFLQNLNGYVGSVRFEQKGFSNFVFPESLNTIRVLTFFDPFKSECFIGFAVHRFGTKKSGHVDNWSSGGISANIDIQTGILSQGVSFPEKKELIWYKRHPDTGHQIYDLHIPNWEKIKQTLLRTANLVPYIPYIGWDVVLSEDEVFILEANSNTDVNLLQVHKPLLSVPGIKEFYKYHKVL